MSFEAFCKVYTAITTIHIDIASIVCQFPHVSFARNELCPLREVNTVLCFHSTRDWQRSGRSAWKTNGGQARDMCPLTNYSCKKACQKRNALYLREMN